MEIELIDMLVNYPKKIAWEHIIDFRTFDERLSAVDCLVVNTIGVSNGFIEFISDNDPPLKEEILCWIWVIRPDLSKDLIKLNEIKEGFKILLQAYIDNEMKRFWDYIA